MEVESESDGNLKGRGWWFVFLIYVLYFMFKKKMLAILGIKCYDLGINVIICGDEKYKMSSLK